MVGWWGSCPAPTARRATRKGRGRLHLSRPHDEARSSIARTAAEVVGGLVIVTIGWFIVRPGRISSYVTDRGQSAFTMNVDDGDAKEVFAG